MKKYLKKLVLGGFAFAIALIGLSFNLAPLSQECDKLIMQNGDEIMVKIVEITPTEIIYRPCNELDGINIRLPLRKAFMIKYANGGKQIFEKDSDTEGRSRSNNSNNRGGATKDAPGSIVSLVLGIIGIVFLIPFGFLGFFAWFFGDKAIKKYDANPELYSRSSRGIALAGKILGMTISILILATLFLILLLLGLR